MHYLIRYNAQAFSMCINNNKKNKIQDLSIYVTIYKESQTEKYQINRYLYQFCFFMKIIKTYYLQL